MMCNADVECENQVVNEIPLIFVIMRRREMRVPLTLWHLGIFELEKKKFEIEKKKKKKLSE